MYKKLCIEAARSMSIRAPDQVTENDIQVIKGTDPFKCEYWVVDNCLDAEYDKVIFKGSKPQCEAFLRGIQYGAKCASSDFAAAF